MRALLRFHRGLMGMPTPWQIWILALVSANLVAPLFFLPRVEAVAALAALVLSMALMTILTHFTGFSRLLGLGHAVWIPLLGFLWGRLALYPADDPFGIWLRVLIALDATSLAIDAVDVVRYAAGDREEMVKTLDEPPPSL